MSSENDLLNRFDDFNYHFVAIYQNVGRTDLTIQIIALGTTIPPATTYQIIFFVDSNIQHQPTPATKLSMNKRLVDLIEQEKKVS